MHNDLLTVAEAALRKSVTPSAVYRAISVGQLPAQRVLGHFAVRVTDLEAWRPKERRGRRKGTPMSEAAKARISQGQKQRWAARKQRG